jgi:hypothetical protein
LDWVGGPHTVQLFNNFPGDEGRFIGPFIGKFLYASDSQGIRTCRTFQRAQTAIALGQVQDTQCRSVGLCSPGQTCAKLIRKLEVITHTTEWVEYNLVENFRKVILNLGANDINGFERHQDYDRIIADFHSVILCLARLGCKELLLVIPPFSAIWWRDGPLSKAHRKLRSYLKTFRGLGNFWDVGQVRYFIRIRVADCWTQFGRPVRGKKQSNTWIEWDSLTDRQANRKNPNHIENRVPLKKHFERHFHRYENGYPVRTIDRLHLNERGQKALLRTIKWGLINEFDREYRHWFHVFEATNYLGSWQEDVNAEPDSDEEFQEELDQLGAQGWTRAQAIQGALDAGL